MKHVRLTGLFSLQSPLSHIAESISTTSYLVQEPILQPDGAVEEVFTYSGNAWRGQLRDMAASYMLERLGRPQLALDAFHLLFSGGRIGGEQAVDVEKARRWRRSVPMLALFGGGVGNQILPGKLRVSNAYPLCKEAVPALPPQHRRVAALLTYRGMTFEKSFSRKDDAKDDRINHALDAPAAPTPAGLLPGMEPSAPKGRAPKKDAKDDGPADQMRMTAELLAAGVQLATEIDALDVTDVELGALVSALHRFSRSPHIGGQSSRGHGRVALSYELLDVDTGELQPFLTIDGGASLLAPPAEQAKAAYDTYLRETYDAMLQAQQPELAAMLGEGLGKK
jgi:hypothetical protein